MDFVQLFIQLLILLCSLTVHEAAHAWSADRLGDPTARRLGRLTLNPAVHIDPIGTLLFPLLAMVTNLPLIGWAKPVPVNLAALHPHPRQKFMVIAAAGPVSNLILAAISAILLRLVGGESSISVALQGAIFVNVLLAVFNMVPVPPLDGGNVLAGLLTGPLAHAYDRLRPYGFVILYALMLSGMLTTIVSPAASVLLGWLL
ncbi:MAG: site-2 protease family protein [Acidobacteria bacterium]|nr:site-2 protease family protein [Acidobacteriota bacterium]